MVRRKSDAVPVPVNCAYHRAAVHERENQRIHEQRRLDPMHEQWSACWCCCTDCEDLTWFYEERQPSEATPSGAPRSTPGTSAG